MRSGSGSARKKKRRWTWTRRALVLRANGWMWTGKRVPRRTSGRRRTLVPSLRRARGNRGQTGNLLACGTTRYVTFHFVCQGGSHTTVPGRSKHQKLSSCAILASESEICMRRRARATVQSRSRWYVLGYFILTQRSLMLRFMTAETSVLWEAEDGQDEPPMIDLVYCFISFPCASYMLPYQHGLLIGVLLEHWNAWIL